MFKPIVVAFALASFVANSAWSASPDPSGAPGSPGSQQSPESPNTSAPSVQLYGTLDLGVTRYTGVQSSDDPAVAVTNTGLSSGIGAATAFGLRGTEPLGSGLSAIFTAETGFCGAGTNQSGIASASPGAPYCSSDGFMQRKAWVGLSGGFGTLTFGKQVTAMALRQSNVDAFGDGYTGAMGNISLVGNNQTQLALARLNQSVVLETPNLNGLKLLAQYSFNSGTGPAAISTGSRPDALIFDVNYAVGPLWIGATHAHYDSFPAMQVPAPKGDHPGVYRLNMVYATYDFGLLKLDAMLQHNTADGYSGDQNVWSVGAVVPHGAGALMASVARHANSMTLEPAVIGKSTAMQYALGYRYALSKRTSLYTSFAVINNGAASANAAGTSFTVASATGSFAGVVGQRSTGFALGMTHTF